MKNDSVMGKVRCDFGFTNKKLEGGADFRGDDKAIGFRAFIRL
jgi:hypothetical protein